MISQLYRIISTLDRGRKKELIFIQLMIIFLSISEIFALSLLVPFITNVIAISESSNNFSLLKNLMEISGFEYSQINVGIFILILIVFNITLGIISTWLYSKFAYNVGADISIMLFKSYLKKEYKFYKLNHFSKLQKNITTETTRISGGVIQPLMQVNSKLILAFLLLVFLFIVEPLVTIVASSIFVSFYFFIYVFLKNKLAENGKVITKKHEERNLIITESFNGIVDIIITGRSAKNIRSFVKDSFLQATSFGENAAFSLLPRYLIEGLTFIGLIVYFIISISNGQSSMVMPTISLFGLSALKLLPALQSVYSGISQIKSNIDSWNTIECDILNYNNGTEMPLDYVSKINKSNYFQILEIESLNFYYGNQCALRNVNLKIKSNSFNWIIGKSGSGKTTLLKCIIGFFDINEGSIKIDGLKVSRINELISIGYVPQNVFLYSSSLVSNVAFGIEEKLIDVVKVKKCLSLAGLSELSNDKSLYMDVGSGGVALSGGQVQRLGIARALYDEPEILVLDESTSALDKISSTLILKTIRDLLETTSTTVIFVTHNTEDIIYGENVIELKDGSIAEGNL